MKVRAVAIGTAVAVTGATWAGLDSKSTAKIWKDSRSEAKRECREERREHPYRFKQRYGGKKDKAFSRCVRQEMREDRWDNDRDLDDERDDRAHRDFDEVRADRDDEGDRGDPDSDRDCD